MKLTRTLRAALAVIALGTFTAGCTSGTVDGGSSQPIQSATTSASTMGPSSANSSSSDPSSPTPSVIDPPTPTVASTDPAAKEATDRAAIEAQWIKFWSAYQVIVRTPESERQNLADSVAVPELANKMVAAAEKADREGKDNFGEVVHSIFWQFDVGGKPSAVIADCLDQSQAGTIDTSTGKILTVGPPRTNMRGEMQLGSDGIWRVKAVTSLNDTPC